MKRRIFFPFALLVCLVLLAIGLCVGAADISLQDIAQVFFGNTTNETARFIILETRLPALLTALIAGIALSIGGLLMQTILENPLAEPGVLGVSAGASLGAAVSMLIPGIAIGGALTAGGTLLTVALSLIGSLVVIALLAVCSTIMRNNALVLIAGVMISYLVGSTTTLLAFYATDYGVQSFVFWGMGDFGQLSADRIGWFAVAVMLGMFPLLFLTKSLDALMLGGDYASALGIRVQTVRTLSLIVCGYLTAAVTAACGPIAFIGLAAPHAARFLLRRSDHATLLPATALCGMLLTLFTTIVCHLPAHAGTLPANAITPLIGVPVIVSLIVKRRRDIY